MYTLISLVYNCWSSRSVLAFFPAIIWTNVGKSLAYRHIGPTTRNSLNFSSFDSGKCPSTEQTPPVGLCPKIPFHMAGIRIEPAMSEPTPKTDAPEPIRAPYIRFFSIIEYIWNLLMYLSTGWSARSSTRIVRIDSAASYVIIRFPTCAKFGGVRD